MGKIVKYCNSCEEGFAEKFVFCPNCGSGLTAFEMNPLFPVTDEISDTEMPIESKAITENEVLTADIEPVFANQTISHDEPDILEMPIVAAPIVAPPIIEKIEEPIFHVTEKTQETFSSFEPEKTITISGFTPVFNQTEATQFSDDEYLGDESAPIHFRKDVGESEYRPTFVEDKNRGNRLKLLLGSLALVTVVMGGGWLYSLFAKALSVDSIGDEIYAYVTPPTDEPFDSEKPPKEKKVGEKSGGGGGGGDNDPKPASAGREARMVEEPLIAPDKSITKVTNPDIPFQAAVKGPKKEYNEDENLPYGVKGTTITDPSNGSGSNGGQGTGRDGGQGPGDGPGIGPGRNGGKGGGSKGGLGPGDGPGGNPPDNEDPPKRPTPRPQPTPEPKPVGVSTPLRITAQPKALYTNEARQNSITGSVRLRVIFLASGQVGNISVISGLPYGLTESAITAAKGIRFEPAKVNGVPQSTTKVMQYSMTLY
jgi:TonB family protein